MWTISAPTDGDLARLAGRLRVLSLAQLLAADLSEKAIRTRVDQGRLQRLWTGMYLVGPSPPEPLSMAHAAGLTFPGRGFATRYWGTHVHGFGLTPSPPVDLLLTRGSHKRDGEILIHRSRNIGPHDIGSVEGIAVTSPARAILDCGDTATVAQLERLIAEAELKKIVKRVQLEDVLSRAGRRKAAKRLAAALADSPGVTRSEAERKLRRILKQADIEPPVTDYKIGPYYADFAWPKPMFIVEFDSYEHHGHKQAFYYDRDRNGWLISKGWDILPVTWEQLNERPLEVAARIAAALALRSR